MIIDTEVEITLNSTCLKHYNNLGYSCKVKDKIIIKTEHLTKGSHTIVNVKCDICGYEKKLMYKYYYESVQNCGYY